MLCRVLIAIAIASSLLMPGPASAKPGATETRARIKVHPTRRWHGYGFLPGYRPQLAEINGQPILGPDPRPKREWRYWGLLRQRPLWLGPSGILSRPLQRRQLRPMLGLDADRDDADLRPITRGLTGAF